MSTIRAYWKAYGGAKELFASDYFFASVAITVGALPLWAVEGDEGYQWVELSFQILPSLMSFSLAALAVLLALSNTLVLRLMRNGGAPDSYLMTVSSSLIHFIVVDFAALFFAVFLRAYQHWAISGVAFLAFAYAIMCGLAAALSIFGVAEIVNHAGLLDEVEDDEA